MEKEDRELRRKREEGKGGGGGKKKSKKRGEEVSGADREKKLRNVSDKQYRGIWLMSVSVILEILVLFDPSLYISFAFYLFSQRHQTL